MIILSVTELEKLLDPTAGKHGGNPESREANKRNLAHRDTDRRRVYDLISEFPRTSKEVAAEMGVPLHHISGRLSELRHIGVIETTGERRSGAAVLKAIASYTDGRI